MKEDITPPIGSDHPEHDAFMYDHGHKPKPKHGHTSDHEHYHRPASKALLTALIVVLVLVALGVAGVFSYRYYYLQQQVSAEYAEDVRQSWQQVVLDSAALAEADRNLTDEESVRSIIDDINTVTGTVESQAVIVAALHPNTSALQANQQQLITVLSDYNTYMGQILTIARDVTAITDDQVITAVTRADTVQAGIVALVTNSFLSDQVATGVFTLPTDLQRTRDNIQKAAKLAEEQAQAEQSQQSAIEAAQAEVERHANKFIEAYINGDKNAIDNYMTDAFIKEFNFDDLNRDGSSGPESFRITEITRDSDTQYTVKGVELDFYTYYDEFGSPTTNKSSSNRVLKIVWSDSYGFWLVDRFTWGD